MGNRNSTKAASNSMTFSEEEEEEENWTNWLEASSTVNGKFVPSFPGTQILTIQPVYRAASESVEFYHKERTQKIQQVKPKSRRHKTVEYYTKGPTKFDGIRYEYQDKHENNSTDSETSDDMANLSENNNIKQYANGGTSSKQHSQEPPIDEEVHKRGFPTGRVYVSLSHDSLTQRLKVTLLKAKNLSCKRTEGKDKCGINCSDSFVKFTLKDDKKELQSHTSAIKKGYSEVLYYENHAFDIENTNLQTLSLEITAVHCSKPHLIHHNHEIGKVVIQGEIAEDSMVDSQLVEALKHPGQVVYEWHTIRS